jgi:hypothetical protein
MKCITFIRLCFLWLLLVGQSSVTLYSQTEDQNLHKYWYYRQRLINDFVVTGSDSGQSLVSGIRNLWDGPAIHYGDAPVYEGYYISTLSTEYRLLVLSHLETNHTLTELYYLLEAINRQGLRAEKLWGLPPSPVPQTGYMLENDVSADFCQRNQARLNRVIADSVVTTGSGKCGMVNNVIGNYSNTDKQDNTCSQDHLANVLVGLAFCARYVGDSLHFHDVITGTERIYSFRSTATAMAARILHYMRDKPFGGHSWILHRPDGTRLSNNKGGIALFNSYGFAKAGTAITGKPYGNFTSSFLSLYWKYIPHFRLLRVNQDNLIFGLELSAVGDSWRGAGKKSKTLKHILRCADYNASPVGLYAANHYGWDQYYGAVFCLLHPAQEQQQLLNYVRIQSILNTAPAQGPFYHAAGDLAPNGWAGSSGRFYDKPPDQDKGKSSFPGNYNGLDYMILYNCYRLLKAGDTALPAYQMTTEFNGTY